VGGVAVRSSRLVSHAEINVANAVTTAKYGNRIVREQIRIERVAEVVYWAPVLSVQKRTLRSIHVLCPQADKGFVGLNFALFADVIETGWNASVDRRDFVRSLVSAVAIAAVPGYARDPLAVGILDGNPRSSFGAGVALGLTEAARSESLFNRKLIVQRAGSDVDNLIARGVTALIGRAAAVEAERIAAACNARHVVYLDCGTRSDELRRRCDAFVFHIEASESMYTNAVKVANGAQVALWHPSLERYGAAQLNDRFRSAANKAMDGAAWCGWFAIKVLVESALRMNENSGAALREHLLQSRTEFDGHKGAPLSFRSWDHQLRQPLYAVSTGKPPRDIPDLSRGEGSMRDQLDSIGDSSSACKLRA